MITKQLRITRGRINLHPLSCWLTSETNWSTIYGPLLMPGTLPHAKVPPWQLGSKALLPFYPNQPLHFPRPIWS